MPFHPNVRPVVSVVADRIYKVTPCVCGCSYGSFEQSADTTGVRAAWDLVHDQHARNDRYTDEERDG